MEKTLIAVPLYNFTIDRELLDKEIVNKFFILDSKSFIEKYQINCYQETPYIKELLFDLEEKNDEISQLYPTAKFVLYKFILLDEKDKNTTNFRNYLKKEINTFLLSLRLVSDGWCQIHNSYFISYNENACFLVHSSSDIDNIHDSHTTVNNGIILEKVYSLTSDKFNKIRNTYSLIKNVKTSSISVPNAYFCRYYNSQTPYDSIIMLAIILESTMLAGKDSELNYRLILRTSAFIGKNLKDILEVFYSIRSQIVHNGIMSQNKTNSSICNKLRKIINCDSHDDIELIVIFTKNYIEPIIRDILYKSLLIFSQTKIQTYEQLIKKIDEHILKQISQDFDIDII